MTAEFVCKIILIDDDPVSVAILEEMLSEKYDIKFSSAKDNVLETCQHFCPDIILLNVGLEDINGFETCQQLKDDKRLNRSKILLLSQHSLIDDKLKGYMVGADDYLVKPFDPSELLMKIKVYTKLINAEKHIEQMNQSLQEQVKLKNEQLMQSEKMASIGQLASGVAHEINNPMCFITTNLEVLDECMKDILKIREEYLGVINKIKDDTIKNELLSAFKEIDEDNDYETIVKDTVDIISDSLEGAERVRVIVNDLKSFSRMDDTKEPVCLNTVLKKSINVVWNQIKNKCKLVQDYQDIPTIMGRQSQLYQVFINLLVNAGHAIKNTGTITIKTYQEINHVYVVISDTGIGIPKEQLDKIFDPFYTTKPVGIGTGLGLSISYAIIEKHQGTIEVTSTINVGTTFKIQLPLTTDPEEAN